MVGGGEERAIYDMSMYHCSSKHLRPNPHTNLYRCHNDLFLLLTLVLISDLSKSNIYLFPFFLKLYTYIIIIHHPYRIYLCNTACLKYEMGKTTQTMNQNHI